MHQGQRIEEETDKKGREKEVSLYKKERCKGGKEGRDKTKKNIRVTQVRKVEAKQGKNTSERVTKKKHRCKSIKNEEGVTNEEVTDTKKIWIHYMTRLDKSTAWWIFSYCYKGFRISYI